MSKSIQKLKAVQLEETSHLKLTVWRVRRGLRNALGVDILDTTQKPDSARAKLREAYLKLDGALTRRLPKMERNTPRDVALKRIRDTLQLELGYEFYEVDEARPWGGFYRIVNAQTEKFLADFFPGLSLEDARLGKKGVELSPKIMVWLPGKRISWQYHYRRAERWHFLTRGKYWRSDADELPKPQYAEPGLVVQFAQGERHRGGALKDSYALVAEIWQHTDPKRPSNEADVVRVSDDFNRPKRPKKS